MSYADELAAQLKALDEKTLERTARLCREVGALQAQVRVRDRHIGKLEAELSAANEAIRELQALISRAS